MQSLLRAGADPKDLVAQIFGGAHINSPDSRDSLGRRNATAARLVLEQYGIQIVRQDVSGPFARRLKFETETGALDMRVIQPPAAANGK